MCGADSLTASTLGSYSTRIEAGHSPVPKLLVVGMHSSHTAWNGIKRLHPVFRSVLTSGSSDRSSGETTMGEHPH